MLSLKHLGKNLVLLLLSSWCLPAFCGVPWLVAAYTQSLSLSSHGFLFCVSACLLLFFFKGTSHYLGLTLIHYILILTQSHLQRSYFQIWSHLRLWINMNFVYSTHYTIIVLLRIHFCSVIFYLTHCNLKSLKIFLYKYIDIIYVLIL